MSGVRAGGIPTYEGSGDAVFVGSPWGANGGEAILEDNLLLACGRAGVFLSDVRATVHGNVVRWNALGLAWQDGADVVLDANDLWCNGFDGPLVDGALTLP